MTMRLKKRLKLPFVFGVPVLVLAFLMPACRRSEHLERIQVKGSDTEVNLVLELAEAYMEREPAVSISITGGGSGVGIAALMNGKTDIANSSREVGEAERMYAHRRGVEIYPTVFAADALVIVANPDAGVDSLTISQVADLFTGSVKNWQEVGGNSVPVSLYGRQSNSGTFLYFRKTVLGRDFSPDLKQMNGTAQIIEAVKNDAGGIGYVGLGYVARPDGAIHNGLKIIRLKKNETSPAASPLDTLALQNGDYPLLRPLYQLTDGKPTGLVEAFLQFETSPAGQQIIVKNGYLPASKLRLEISQNR